MVRIRSTDTPTHTHSHTALVSIYFLLVFSPFLVPLKNVDMDQYSWNHKMVEFPNEKAGHVTIGGNTNNFFQGDYSVTPQVTEKKDPRNVMDRFTVRHAPFLCFTIIYIYIYIHTHTHTYIYIYIYSHTHTCIYIFIYIYIYVRIYIHAFNYNIIDCSKTGNLYTIYNLFERLFTHIEKLSM